MDDRNEILAAKVVEAFKDNISAEARAHISESEFSKLGLIVQEALSLEMAETVEMVQELEERLRRADGRRQLEL